MIVSFYFYVFAVGIVLFTFGLFGYLVIFPYLRKDDGNPLPLSAKLRGVFFIQDSRFNNELEIIKQSQVLNSDERLFVVSDGFRSFNMKYDLNDLKLLSEPSSHKMIWQYNPDKEMLVERDILQHKIASEELRRRQQDLNFDGQIEKIVDIAKKIMPKNKEEITKEK